MYETAAARLAESLRTAMKDQALSGAGLAERIEQLTGTAPTAVWVSRRLGGSRPKALLDVDPDLFVIARALEIDRAALIELVVHAVFGDPVDEPIPYELTDKQPPDPTIGHAFRFGEGDGCAWLSPDTTRCGLPRQNYVHQIAPGSADEVEVPPRPTEAEYGDMPVLDPTKLIRCGCGPTHGPQCPQGL